MVPDKSIPLNEDQMKIYVHVLEKLSLYTLMTQRLPGGVVRCSYIEFGKSVIGNGRNTEIAIANLHQNLTQFLVDTILQCEPIPPPMNSFKRIPIH